MIILVGEFSEYSGQLEGGEQRAIFEQLPEGKLARKQQDLGSPPRVWFSYPAPQLQPAPKVLLEAPTLVHSR